MKQLITLIAALFPFAAIAEDHHLVPDESVFSRGMPPAPYFSFGDDNFYDPNDYYYKSVLSVFHRAFEHDIVGRVIVLPEGRNEHAIALSHVNGRWKIIHLRPEIYISKFGWLNDYRTSAISASGPDAATKNAEIIAELEAELPSSIADVAVEQCELQINDALGLALYTVWSEMLFRTRYVDARPVTPDDDPRPTIRLDGVSYHFSFDYGYERLTGKTWSPKEATITGKFVSIAKQMRSACESQNTETLTKLVTTVSALMIELSASSN